MCYLSDVCFRLLRICRTLLQLLRVSSCQSVNFARDQHWGSGRLCTVIVCITCSTMASSDDRSCRPRDDRSGVHLRNELRKTWKAPKSFIDQESPLLFLMCWVLGPFTTTLSRYGCCPVWPRTVPGSSSRMTVQ